MNEIQKLLKDAATLFDNEQYTDILLLLPDELLDKYNSIDLYVWRSKAHDRLREGEKGLAYADKAILIDPNHFLGYRQRGNAWYTIGDFDKALESYNKSIDLKDDGITHYNRGVTWNRKGEYNKAISDYNRAIDLGYNKDSVYFNRGNSFANKNEFDKAIEDYSKVIAINPSNEGAYNNRGIAWYKKDEYDKAIADYTMAIELNNKNSNASNKRNSSKSYNNLGIVYYNMLQYDKAIESFTKAIELKIPNANALTNRGHVFYDMGDFQKALNDYKQALEYEPSLKKLEYNIRLSTEKLEERSILEKSDARPDDKAEKLLVEKEIQLVISAIRELSKSQVKTLVHYTKVFVADLYVKNRGTKMHFSNAIYMNDPMEGKVFFEYLNDKTIEASYRNGEKRTETSVYLGSFLPAEDTNGEVSHEDELVMWRTYGKDENGKEATGCSIVLSSDFFKIEALETEESALSVESEELLNVIYIKNLKRSKSITNDIKGKIELKIKTLKVHLKRLIKLKNKYKPKDDFYKEIENAIFKQLSTISYLFKSADYDFEHEVRVITYMPRDSDLIKFRESNELNTPNKKFYIESYNDILPFIKKIYLGPKVEHYQQWSLYLDYEIRQRAKEFEMLIDPPYKIKPSDIEIMKSDCKFQ